jgi:hypothetical protein
MPIDNKSKCTPSQKMRVTATTSILCFGSLIYLLFDCHQNPQDRYWKELCRHNDDYELTDIIAGCCFVIGVVSTYTYNNAYEEYKKQDITTPSSPRSYQADDSGPDYSKLESNNTDKELPVKKDEDETSGNCCVMM